MKRIIFIALCAVFATQAAAQTEIGETYITKWPDGKRGAVSITYDDGTINQFRVAMPIMQRLELPATFFINTSVVSGSTRMPKFIGRPIAEIIAETAMVPTDADNLFERASAARFVEVQGAGDRFSRAGAQIDAGRIDAACDIIDEFYAEVRSGGLAPVENWPADPTAQGALSWDEARAYTEQGYEFASHMVTHPYMSALDEANLVYELEASRNEILEQLGVRSTISCEMPYGTNDDRAVGYMLAVYPVSRNRMELDYMLELHRSSNASPLDGDTEYVQWQRGILSRTSLEQMNGWVDVAAEQDNIWLVTVIHGVDGIGWEPMTTENLEAHFSHIASRKEDLWMATFGDAGRYIKERMSARVVSRPKGRNIVVEVDHPLDKELFDLPLTLKTCVDPAWRSVRVVQGRSESIVAVHRNGDKAWVLYNATPGEEKIELRHEN